MKSRNYNVIGYDMRYWWNTFLSGILFVGLGLWISLSTEKSYLFLSLLLAIGLFTTGMFETLFSLLNRKAIKDWGWIFIGGFIDLILGIYLLSFPLLAMVLMPLIIGLWMLFRSFMTVSSPVNLKAAGLWDWIWLLITSIVLILPSLIILINPFFGLVNIVLCTGIAFIIAGIFRIYFSQQLRRLNQAKTH